MKRIIEWSLSLSLLLVPALGLAAVPPTMSFSARIADGGTPVTGDHTFVFAFWDCDGSVPESCLDPDNVLWTETQTLTVNGGVVAATLGAVETLDPAIFTGAGRWLAVTMDGAAFGPRVAVHAVPYAFRAAKAESLECSGCVEDSAIAGISGSKVSGTVASATTAADVACTGCVEDSAIATGISGSKVTGAVASANAAPWSGITGRPTFACHTHELTVSVSGDGSIHSTMANCGSGETLTGGGFRWEVGAAADLVVVESRPNGGWSLVAFNNSGTARNLIGYAICCNF